MDKTKNALVTILETGNKVISSLSDDGKIDFGEGVGIAMKGVGLVKVFKDIPEIKEEISTMTQEDSEDLVELFKEEFDLPNDEAEQKVEQGIEVLTQLVTMLFAA